MNKYKQKNSLKLSKAVSQSYTKPEKLSKVGQSESELTNHIDVPYVKVMTLENDSLSPSFSILNTS